MCVYYNCIFYIVSKRNFIIEPTLIFCVKRVGIEYVNLLNLYVLFDKISTSANTLNYCILNYLLSN